MEYKKHKTMHQKTTIKTLEKGTEYYGIYCTVTDSILPFAYGNKKDLSDNLQAEHGKSHKTKKCFCEDKKPVIIKNNECDNVFYLGLLCEKHLLIDDTKDQQGTTAIFNYSEKEFSKIGYGLSYWYKSGFSDGLNHRTLKCKCDKI
jgi:hypothetical protein